MSGSSSGEITVPKISDQIPHDLVTEILARLPAKSLARFVCVSKTWASTIRSRDFHNSFVTRSSTRPSILLALSDTHRDRRYSFFSFPISDNEESPSLAYHGYMKRRTFSMFHSVRGLICLKCSSSPVILNPSLRKAVTLPVTTPNLRPEENDRYCYLGYDPIEDHYKVLSIETRLSYRSGTCSFQEIRILTLGEDRLQWRKIEGGRFHFPDSPGTCINGVLFYRAYIKHVGITLVRFDVKTEKFSFINAPNHHLPSRLTDYRGKLAVYGPIRRGFLRLFVLEDTEKNEWSNKLYVMPHSWRDLVPGGDELFDARFTDSGGIVLAPYFTRSERYYVIHCNPERNILERLSLEDPKN
ncbi:PREDICTED: putative F-box protein At1g20657 [Tarenaya hassleriana]|uniref:putative F-box protein At1g20657 n=1 Tax=Tarenaya hassleriana TaxID=28532 RepID=UPI00053C3930|nr:PREDICTED: putative F-box protein At1g20657 [Tarenaya hassleriana]